MTNQLQVHITRREPARYHRLQLPEQYQQSTATCQHDIYRLALLRRHSENSRPSTPATNPEEERECV